jgi:predicted transcriptional regulator
MKISGNAAFIRKLNRQIILNKILEGEVVSGAELSRLTELRPSTVSGILKELAKRKLIIRSGRGNRPIGGGEKPVLWRLNDKYHLVGLESIKGE